MLIYIYRKSIIILFFICICTSANATNNHIKLKNLTKQITQVKTDINQKEKQQISVGQQLKNLRARIKILEANYQTTLKNLKKQKIILEKLNTDQEKEQLKLKEARQKFYTQMKMAYQIERSDYIKTVFNKDSGANSDLLFVYNKYIFAARIEQMQSIKKTLEHIAINKWQIKKQTKILEDLESSQQKQKQEVTQAEREYNNILGSLKVKIATQNQKLKQLVSAKSNLEKLIIRLNRLSIAGERKTVVISPKLMLRLCRNFVWPTKGVITTHFGSPIEQSSWSWSGIIITAPKNQAIRAISSGTVVYAAWFAGYGLLLIIDHGSGYMSLYGHNNSLRKKINDQVKAGEVVAAVGKSGREDPGLYFSIRYNGKPVNPEGWCR